MKKISLFGLALTLLAIVATQVFAQNQRITMQPNGFLIGDDTQLPAPLILAIGDSEHDFAVRNPQFSEFGRSFAHEPYVLPILARTFATYDDKRTTYKVGCSFTTDIVGDKTSGRIRAIGFRLCDAPIDDWQAATQALAERIKEFSDAHPQLESLQNFRKTHSDEEVAQGWGGILFDRMTKTKFPVTQDGANQFFAREAAAGSPRELKLNQNTFLVLAVFRSEEIVVSFGISKERNKLEADSTHTTKMPMKYITVISISRRPDLT